MIYSQIDRHDYTLSNKLRATLKRISDNLILNEDEDESRGDKIAHPHISPIVDLTGHDKLHGLAERTVATESLYVIYNYNFSIDIKLSSFDFVI